MKAFTKTDQRQFVDEVYFLNLDKDFKGTFVDTLKGSLTFKDVERILEKKRKAYNHALTNLYRKYGILPDDFYSQLDELWDSVPLSDIMTKHLKKLLPAGGVGKLAGSALLLAVPIAGLLLEASTVVAVGIVQYGVRTKWEGYKTKALKFSDDYSKKQIAKDVK